MDGMLGPSIHLSRSRSTWGCPIPLGCGGGDSNRPPQVLLEEGLHIPAQAHPPKGEGSTCTTGGLINYFLTPQEQELADQCIMMRGTCIRPHYPVSIQINRRPHLTQVLEPIGAKKWPEGGPAFPKPMWDHSQAKLQEWGWKVPRSSTMNPTQEYYLDNFSDQI